MSLITQETLQQIRNTLEVVRNNEIKTNLHSVNIYLWLSLIIIIIVLFYFSLYMKDVYYNKILVAQKNEKTLNFNIHNLVENIQKEKLSTSYILNQFKTTYQK